ncbi:transcriptional regulator, TetR family [Ruegeria halocynthiae]|uniref:Transcriptional regulator, TetR family n=1 Tax=Ruegeria halocynthiae TaxID=985054 RepID=A0A1H2ZLR5_9RHOB|nr:TetR/AcrR family transcriptional regulator [Ruegeria halocynthiae]SDX18291.1 transcriptional regulator, TetR family [Ruegeria halocynthiae]
MSESKRDILKRKILGAAEKRIETQGLAALRARDVTKDAGCALGSLYNAFEDLDLLILAVNSRTLARLHASLQSASASQTSPKEKLLALALAYQDFGTENPNLWAALFDHRMQPGVPVPQWHLEEHVLLISEVIGPLSQLNPNLDDDMLASRARTVFSAVHGIVKLSLDGRFVALDPDKVKAELSEFVSQYLRGNTSEKKA